MRYHRDRRALAAETLEKRVLLSGDVIVSVSGANLIVDGDDQDNQIEIVQENGALLIEGVEGTTVNGEESVEMAVPGGDLRIRMRQGGVDEVSLLGEITLPGGLRVKMDEGSLTVDGTVGAIDIGDELFVQSGGDVAVLNDVQVAGDMDITADGVVSVLAGRASVPTFSAASFDDSLTIDNPYLPLVVGTTYTYEATLVDEETGEEHTEVTVVEVLPETRTILGVEVRVVRDRVFVDDVLQEDTFDFFGQDNNGNVWYFGEEVTNFVYNEDGTLASTNDEGSFEAGVDGASAGIGMEADPQVGDRYFQEVAPGVALDQAEVLATDESATVPVGTFASVLQTEETTVLEPDALEQKFYAPGLGLIREQGLDIQTHEDTGSSELVSVELNGVPVTQVVSPEGFEGTNAVGETGRRVRVLGDASIESLEDVSVRETRFRGTAQIISDGGVTVMDSLFEDPHIRAEDTIGLSGVGSSAPMFIRGNGDLFIFDSSFDDTTKVQLGPNDDTFAVEGSEFTSLLARGGKGDNTFEDNGDNVFGELQLIKFTEA